MSRDVPDGSAFAVGTTPWLGRLSSLRNIVRQELVARRLADVDLPGDANALDVGAGQGTQAIALARRGVHVTALEPDPTMRAACRDALADEDRSVRARVQVVDAALDDLPSGVDAWGGEGRRHDLVLCHGVLMYLDDPRPAVRRLADRVAPRGSLSILARNAAAVPVRPMLRGDWSGVLAAFDELARAKSMGDRPGYRNELGVLAHADDVDSVVSWLDAIGDWTHGWTGVRLASDGATVDRPPTDADELARLVEAEERLGRADPYRRLASLFHLVSRRDAGGG